MKAPFMWWALGIGIWAVLLLIVVALCRAAGAADRTVEELAPKSSPAKKHRDHAA